MTFSTTARTGATAATFAMAALLAACGSSGDGASTDGGDTTTKASVTTTEATSTTAGDGSTTTPDGTTTTAAGDDEGRDTETTELDTLPDGDHYVYMAGLEEGKVEGQAVQVVIVDPVDMLTGQEAIDAAAEDGVTLDTDYYIRNTDQTVKRIAVVPDASVTTLEEGTSGTVPSSVSEVWQQDHLFKINVGNVRGITTISSIDAVYLP